MKASFKHSRPTMQQRIANTLALVDHTSLHLGKSWVQLMGSERLEKKDNHV